MSRWTFMRALRAIGKKINSGDGPIAARRNFLRLASAGVVAAAAAPAVGVLVAQSPLQASGIRRMGSLARGGVISRDGFTIDLSEAAFIEGRSYSISDTALPKRDNPSAMSNIVLGSPQRRQVRAGEVELWANVYETPSGKQFVDHCCNSRKTADAWAVRFRCGFPSSRRVACLRIIERRDVLSSHQDRAPQSFVDGSSLAHRSSSVTETNPTNVQRGPVGSTFSS